MTKQTRTKEKRKKFNIPPERKVASVRVDHDKKQIVFITKDMIKNQLHRDGPKIRRTFDVLAKPHISACSELFGEAVGLIVRHLPRLDDEDYKATVSRLLNSAANTYLASIEVARHGYRRQYGMLARSFIETIATVIAIAIEPDALERFHAGKLQSTKCVGWAKGVVAPLGMYYGMLSKQFVHIGPAHAAFEPIAPYSAEDEALAFIISSMRGNAWLLYLAAELVAHDEIGSARYWKALGGGAVSYDPSEKEREWMADFLVTPD
ncbi:hypothetical protein GRI44_04585 [Altererythrobacter confluentis]|uniref:Uncharacterized protein n=1 Tax=Allopontixanthobacter confluentis TaxID=1849021 RepID=A0A6L7GFI5_9SPHN|nr:hypothetical protein [Allopontixanthobacter confluentis]MXP14024.1 hypothetical protein [Allopontixanthobacter confluentis]